MSSEPARIMIVDDNEAIHHDFKQILDRSARAQITASLDDLERELGGDPVGEQAPFAADYDLAFVSQGEDAVRAIGQARGRDRPFACAFVDIRMPPGIDGIETVARMW